MAVLAGLAPAPAGARTVIRAGEARFEVITPTLIRAEFAQDGRFENRPTQTARRGPLDRTRVSVTRAHGWLTIATGEIALRYRPGLGAFSAASLQLVLGHGSGARTVRPAPGDPPGTLGGWQRALDLQAGPVPLHPGLLDRSGWYVLDDTATAILTHGGSGFLPRPAHAGPYQDWYLFAYGHDYARALSDLRVLSGPAPLPPRTAFGVWFSRYWPYSASDYRDLLAQFRQNRLPLDTLSVDTDFKRESNAIGAALAASAAGAPGKPYSWDGWEWDTSLFPDPAAFISWAHRQGVSIALNIHPSISTNDPKYPQAEQASGGLTTSSGLCRILIADPFAQCAVFDWTSPRQLAAYFALHREFEHDGADVFWLDWCCDDSSASAPGLTPDTWINSRYAAAERARGLRWPAFSRAGARYDSSAPNDGDQLTAGEGIFAEHRYTMQFTGDTCATWSMLGFEAEFTAAEGASVGLPYVTHDIGSFNGAPENGQCSGQTGLLNERLPDDLYARWVALGTFQPIDRLHSNHGMRLPWEYGPAADAAASSFLRLREALNPYIYTLARRAYDTGLPLTAPLYLQWPGQSAAYRNPSEYTFGPDLVVAPVTTGGDPAPATLWVPPGTWIDLFTGGRFRGPAMRTLSVPLDQMPVLVRAGAVIPTQPYAPFTTPGPSRSLILTVYPGASGACALYDDAGLGFGYQGRAFAFTPVVHRTRRMGPELVIGPEQGHFPGQLEPRAWEIRFPGVARPRRVRVNGRSVPFRYWPATRTLTVAVGPRRTDRKLTVTAG